ncbi:hypothetical protein IKG05_01750, partial [Candidatus Saccharibacteria bacterium]|nr:hypothetical protein [Candidatus Saccharibacteria bacterium]
MNKNGLFVIVLLFFAVACVVFCAGTVYAAGGGAVIGGNANYAGGGGGWGGGAPPFSGTNSWIFYKATGEVTGKINFVPDPNSLSTFDSSNNNEIASECSEHDGGFWHYGNDAWGRDLSCNYSGNCYYNFGLLSFLWGFSNSSYLYWLEDDSSWGHFWSYNYSNKDGRPNYYSQSWMLGQHLYLNGTEIYYADHYDDPSDNSSAETTNNALTQFKQAYKYYYNQDYPYGNKFPEPGQKGSTYYFCWWPGMGDQARRLKLVPKRLFDWKTIKNSVIPTQKTDVTSGTAALTRKTADGYAFAGFRISPTASNVSATSASGHNIYRTKVPADSSTYNTINVKYAALPTTMYAVYSVKFEGMSRVGVDENDLTNHSTGYTGTTPSTNPSLTISNCNGSCEATIAHSLRTYAGNINAKIASITVDTNIPGVASGALNLGGLGNPVNQDGTVKLSKNKEGGYYSTRARTQKYTLHPGEYVCETMTFYTRLGEKYSTAASTKACAYAEGPSETSLSMKVKNTSVSAYNNWLDEVYAKPGDALTYQATYMGGAQGFANYKPDKMKVINGSSTNVCPESDDKAFKDTANYKDTTVANALSARTCGGNTWANGFSVSSSGFTMTRIDKKYTNGDTSSHQESNNHTVTLGEVGTELKETANTNDGVKTVPKSASVKNECFGGKCYNRTVTVDLGSLSDSAVAKVPYNFKNSTSISSEGNVYAGEPLNVEVNYTIGRRENTVTTNAKDKSRSYVTNVPGDIKVGLQVCINNCGTNGNNFRVDSETEETISTNSARRSNFAVGNMWEDKVVPGGSQDINIPDVKAGTQVCIRSKIWPADSGANTNIDANSINKSWTYSAPVCFSVAKRPSMQIWGGNTYINGNADTAVAAKTSVSGYNVSGSRVFGSWTELGLLATGSVKGLSSANNLGYAANTNGVLGATASSPGGGIN